MVLSVWWVAICGVWCISLRPKRNRRGKARAVAGYDRRAFHAAAIWLDPCQIEVADRPAHRRLRSTRDNLNIAHWGVIDQVKILKTFGLSIVYSNT